jgi:hypothetical protein
MRTNTRLRILGAGLSIAVLFAGHSVVTVHADATGDALLLADGFTSNAVDLANAELANAGNPDTTCKPVSQGATLINNTNSGPIAVPAEDAALGSVTCFSFSNSTYTLWTRIIIQDETSPGVWQNTTCSYAPGGMQAVEGAVTVPLPVTCAYPVVPGPTILHIHRALVLFNTSTGYNGTPTPSLTPWPIYY